MIAGMPFETWLLLILSVAIPLAIELKFYFTHRNEKQKKVDRESGE
jgi:hypothetical protein